MKNNHILRLHTLITDAGVPINGVSGDSAGIRIDFNITATPSQITQANSIVSSFDWSDAAHAIWENIQNRTEAKQVLTNTRPQDKIIKALLAVMLDEINILRTAASLPARTRAQFVTAIQNKIDSGGVD